MTETDGKVAGYSRMTAAEFDQLVAEGLDDSWLDANAISRARPDPRKLGKSEVVLEVRTPDGRRPSALADIHLTLIHHHAREVAWHRESRDRVRAMVLGAVVMMSMMAFSAVMLVVTLNQFSTHLAMPGSADAAMTDPRSEFVVLRLWLPMVGIGVAFLFIFRTMYRKARARFDSQSRVTIRPADPTIEMWTEAAFANAHPPG